MSLSHWFSLLQQVWLSHPDASRWVLAWLAYLGVVSLTGSAAALISSEMPFFDNMPSI